MKYIKMGWALLDNVIFNFIQFIKFELYMITKFKLERKNVRKKKNYEKVLYNSQNKNAFIVNYWKFLNQKKQYYWVVESISIDA